MDYRRNSKTVAEFRNVAYKIMAIKLPDGRYKCSWCNKIYSDPSKADACRADHDIVYVPMLRSDINRLLQFMITKDDKLITETMHRSLTKFLGRIL